MDLPTAQKGHNGRRSGEQRQDVLKSQLPVGITSIEQRRPQQELYAGNLPSNISMMHLDSLFSKYKPKHIQKVENKKKCYAFIDFEDSEMLELAKKQLNNTIYKGRRLVLHRAHRNRKEHGSRKSINPKQSDVSKDSEDPSDVIRFTCPQSDPDFGEGDMCTALGRNSLCANSEYLSCEEDEKGVCEIPDQEGHVTHKQTLYVTQGQDMLLTHKQNACTIQDQSVYMTTVLHQQSRNLDLEEKKLLLEIEKLHLEIRKLEKEKLMCKCIGGGMDNFI